MAASITIAFGESIRDARVSKGYSQEELADLCGFHRTYVSDIELGKRNVSLVNIQRLCRALDTPMSSVFAQMEAEFEAL